MVMTNKKNNTNTNTRVTANEAESSNKCELKCMTNEISLQCGKTYLWKAGDETLGFVDEKYPTRILFPLVTIQFISFFIFLHYAR